MLMEDASWLRNMHFLMCPVVDHAVSWLVAFLFVDLSIGEFGRQYIEFQFETFILIFHYWKQVCMSTFQVEYVGISFKWQDPDEPFDNDVIGNISSHWKKEINYFGSNDTNWKTKLIVYLICTPEFKLF